MLRELLAAFHIEVDDDDLKKADSAISSFKEVLKDLGETVADAFAFEAIKSFVEEQIEAGVQLTRMSAQLGTTTDELQALELAAGEASVSVDAMTTGIRFLNRNLGEAAQGGEKAAVFKKLGIAIKDASGEARPAGDVMVDLADAIAKMPSQAEKTTTAMKLLGRGGVELIPLLNKGGEAFEEARKDVIELGGGMSHEFLEATEKAEEATKRLTFSMTGLKSTIANALLPGFTEVVEWFVKMTVRGLELLKSTTALSSAVYFFGTVAAVRAAQSLLPLVARLALLETEMFGLSIPVWAVIAGLAILYVGFDDLYAFLNGNESVIGDTLDHFFGLGTAAQFAKDLKESIAALADIVVDVGTLVVNSLVSPFEILFHLAKGLGEALGDLASGNFDAAGASLSKGLDDAQKGFDTRRKNVGEASDRLVDDVTLTSGARRQKKINQRNAGQTYESGADLLRPGGGEGEAPDDGTPAMLRRAGRKNIYGDTIPDPSTPGVVPTVESPMVVPASVAASGGGAGGGGTTTIHQKNDTKIDFHGDVNDKKAVGDTVTQGVTTAHEREYARAAAATGKP